MQINTTRFGTVELLPEDILLFPAGLFGFEEALHWVLLGDAENDSLAWLQSVSQPELALPVGAARGLRAGRDQRDARSARSLVLITCAAVVPCAKVTPWTPSSTLGSSSLPS